jgi:diaminopimelate epimerase
MNEIKNTPIYRFTGAGNNFVVLDGRGKDMAPWREVPRIQMLCRRFRTDGLMILETAEGVDFTMDFYNPDGSGGMMCGNGGRCIVAFADYLGLKPAAADGTWLFRAPDGLHTAEILSRRDRCWSVRLKMVDVHGVRELMDGYFLNTGTRHFVKFVDDVDTVDVDAEGRALRHDPAFAPEGTNVNFVEKRGDVLYVRTFEKGVEGETLACGTGLTASAIAASFRAGRSEVPGETRLVCRRGDELGVRFQVRGGEYTDVYLTGPAELLSVE